MPIRMEIQNFSNLWKLLIGFGFKSENKPWLCFDFLQIHMLNLIIH